MDPKSPWMTVVLVLAAIGLLLLASLSWWYLVLFMATFLVTSSLIFLAQWSRKTFYLFVAALLLVAGLVIHLLSRAPVAYDLPEMGTVTEYTVRAIPSKDNFDEFEVTETAQVVEQMEDEDHPAGVEILPKTKPYKLVIKQKLKGKKQGLIAFETTFKTLDMKSDKNLAITKNGKKVEKKEFMKDDKLGVFVYECKDSLIEVRDLPLNTFLEARDRKADIATFKDKETAKWNLQALDPERDIGFTFLRPVWGVGLLRGLSTPFLYAKSFGEFLWLLIPTILAFVAKSSTAMAGEWLKTKLGGLHGFAPPAPHP